MKNALILFLLFFLTSCASPPHRKPPTIVADGTEVEQFENLFFCGNIELFSKAMGEIGEELTGAWDQVEGEASADACTVYIQIDHSGLIVDHRIVECEKSEVVSQVMSLASPLNTPADKCLIEKISGIKFVLNGVTKNDS